MVSTTAVRERGRERGRERERGGGDGIEISVYESVARATHLCSLKRKLAHASCRFYCIVLYLYLFKEGKSTDTVYSKKRKEKKKPRSLRYIDTDFR